MHQNEYSWKTVDVMTVGGTAYAYQQKHEVIVEKEKRKDKRYGTTGGMGLGMGLGTTIVPKDEHRLKEMEETLNEESIKKATGEHLNASE